MLAIVAKYSKDVSVLRRLLFAASYLPQEIPNFGGIAVEFATAGKVERNAIDADTAIEENIHTFDQKAFETDIVLLQQLYAWKPSVSGSGYFDKPLGMVLISRETECLLCGQPLSLRKDRPSSIVVYDDSSGPVSGTHYNKTCTSKVRTITQYYGYYTSGKATSQVLQLQLEESAVLHFFVTYSLFNGYA